MSIPIPRGESRATLQEAGLVGKVSINSYWKEADIEREFTSLFASLAVSDKEIKERKEDEPLFLSSIRGNEQAINPRLFLPRALKKTNNLEVGKETLNRTLPGEQGWCSGRALAFHQCGLSSIPRLDVISGLSLFVL